MAKPNPRSAAAVCPCGSGDPYSRCCRPFHLRTDDPPTAQQLMRSRYSAYAKGLGSYLLHSWHPDHRPVSVDLDPRHRWTGLTILATTAGRLDDETGTVEFVATFEIDRGAGPRSGELHEVSTFSRIDDRWVYEAEAAPAR